MTTRRPLGSGPAPAPPPAPARHAVPAPSAVELADRPRGRNGRRPLGPGGATTTNSPAAETNTPD